MGVSGPSSRVPQLEDLGQALGGDVAAVGAGGASDDPLVVSVSNEQAIVCVCVCACCVPLWVVLYGCVSCLRW